MKGIGSNERSLFARWRWFQSISNHFNFKPTFKSFLGISLRNEFGFAHQTGLLTSCSEISEPWLLIPCHLIYLFICTYWEPVLFICLLRSYVKCFLFFFNFNLNVLYVWMYNTLARPAFFFFLMCNINKADWLQDRLIDFNRTRSNDCIEKMANVWFRFDTRCGSHDQNIWEIINSARA